MADILSCPTDAQQATAELGGGTAAQPVMYIPTPGVLEDGTIQLQVTADGKLIFPPGLRLYMADEQEVSTSTGPVDEQAQQEQPRTVEDTSNHLASRPEDSSAERQSAGDSHDNGQGQA